MNQKNDVNGQDLRAKMSRAFCVCDLAKSVRIRLKRRLLLVLESVLAWNPCSPQDLQGTSSGQPGGAESSQLGLAILKVNSLSDPVSLS